MGATRTKMSATFVLLVACCAGVCFNVARAQTTTTAPVYNYQALYETQYSASHILPLNNGQEVQLVLDASSGAGYQSISEYTFGFFSSAIKLVPGNSAGTVTAFFLSSAGNNHDEIDYEFLGNVSGQPYILQTNLFANGVGGREQRIYLWFDPAADFHTYGILWNHFQIIWLVDNTPIRVFKNLASQGLAYPSSQPAQAFSDIFDASSWATRGGAVGVDWAAAPFTVNYGEFQLDACVNDGVNVLACSTNYQSNWWEGAAYTTLSASQISELQNIRQSYLVYDYCTDIARNPVAPPECAANYNT